MMSTKEIRERETEALTHELADKQKHMFDLRSQAVTEKLEDPSQIGKTRKTIIMNFGRREAGVWAGYAPKPQTLEAATSRQREILSNGDRVWREDPGTGM